METVLGLTIDQLLIWVGLGVILLVGLLVLKFVLKLSMSLIKLGCLGILVVMFLACIAMWMFPG